MMAKKIIQVPVDEDLLVDLDRLSEDQDKSRSEIIRQACRLYLDKIESLKLDVQYQQGYEKIPEDSKIAEAQIDLVREILPEEKW